MLLDFALVNYFLKHFSTELIVLNKVYSNVLLFMKVTRKFYMCNHMWFDNNYLKYAHKTLSKTELKPRDHLHAEHQDATDIRDNKNRIFNQVFNENRVIVMQKSAAGGRAGGRAGVNF